MIMHMTASVISPPKPRLTDVRSLLRSATGSPTQRACAVATLGHRLGLPPAAVRLYVTRSGDPELTAIASNPIVWSRLSDSARAKVAGSSSLAGRAALRREVARRLVARVLLPVDPDAGLTPHRVVAARHATALVGVEVLRATARGMDAVYVPESDLAVRMGVGRLSARSALQACESLGWVRATKRAKGSAALYKLPRLPRSVENAALTHWDLIERLGDPDAAAGWDDEDHDPETAELLAGLPDPGLAAEVLLSVDHPAWAHSKVTGGPRGALTRTHWLVLLADQAGVDPVALGVPDRAVKSARRDLERAGVGPAQGGSLVDRLDWAAAETGAAGRHREAWAARTAEKARRKVERARVAAEREAARARRRGSGPVQSGTPVVQAVPGEPVVAVQGDAVRSGGGPMVQTDRSNEPVQMPRSEAPREVRSVRVPEGFDPARHGAALVDRLEQAGHGGGWIVDRVVDGVAHVSRPA